MRVLLDTHTFLWWATDDPQLSPQARQIIANGQNEVYLSSASVWEIAIKASRGRLILPEPPAHYVTSRMAIYRFQALPVQISHAAYVFELPPYHKDPFDRLLVAQSRLESLPLLTKDEDVLRFGLDTIW